MLTTGQAFDKFRQNLELSATEREDDESETAQRYKARWPMRYVGKQHANSVGDVSGCSKGIDQTIRRRLDFVAC